MVVACSTSVRCNSNLEQALTDIAAAGFKWVDLLLIDGWVHIHTKDLVSRFETTAATLDALLKQHALTPIALNTGVGPQLHQRDAAINRQRNREVAAIIHLATRYGITIAAIQPRNPDPARPYQEVLRDCLLTLREQIAAGAAEGLTFALELHVNSPFETLEQAKLLLAQYPDIPLIYDPSHFVSQGIDLRETGWLMTNAKHVHLRDAAPGSLQTPYGEGTVDFDWLLGALKDHGYQGHFSLEYLETDAFDALASAARLYERVARDFTSS